MILVRRYVREIALVLGASPRLIDGQLVQCRVELELYRYARISRLHKTVVPGLGVTSRFVRIERSTMRCALAADFCYRVEQLEYDGVVI